MNDFAAAFGDQAELARCLLAALSGDRSDGTDCPGATGRSLSTGQNDGSHDQSHLLRVWRNATAIAEREGVCDRAVLTAAVILHDCVAVEKNSPQRSQASRLASARSRTILAQLGWNAMQIDAAAHAIEAHSFSAGIAPRTLEARIVQDADRLDAIGAIGIARCFYIAGRMGSGLYDPADPSARNRDLNDGSFALDHFGAKLFPVSTNFQTKAGQASAASRARTMRGFVDVLLEEIGEDDR